MFAKYVYRRELTSNLFPEFSPFGEDPRQTGAKALSLSKYLLVTYSTTNCELLWKTLGRTVADITICKRLYGFLYGIFFFAVEPSSVANKYILWYSNGTLENELKGKVPLSTGLWLDSLVAYDIIWVF